VGLIVDTNVFVRFERSGGAIAATACHYGFSLLTDNVAEFSRVPKLKVVPFTA
jgi:hypothetical protein